MATTYRLLYNSLSFSVGRAFNLLPTNRIWQGWLNAISVIMLYCIRLQPPSWLSLKSCLPCCLWSRQLLGDLKLQGNTFLQVKWTTGVSTVRRSQIQTYFSALSVNGIWFLGKSGCSLPGSDSTAGFQKARFTVYFIREHPCNNNSSSYIKRGQGSPVNKTKTSKHIVKAINC